jgi:predicted nucleotidyltransferase
MKQGVRAPLSSTLHEEDVMLTREEIIEILQENHSYFATEFGVKKIGLFGSYVKGQPNEASDVDVFVEFRCPIGLKFVEFAEYLERLLGRKVDILTPAGIQGIRIARIAKDIADSIVYV